MTGQRVPQTADLLAPLGLTTGADWCPAVSPDGKRVAFISDRGGYPQVWVQWLAGGGATVIDTGPAFVGQVSWSPTGDWLALSLSAGGAPRAEVWVVTPEGRGLRQVAGFGTHTAMPGPWTPAAVRDGRPLLGVTESGGASTALLVDPLDGRRRSLLSGDLLHLVDVSTDGSRALLRQGPRGARWLLVADRRTGECRPLGGGARPVQPHGGSSDRGWFSADGSQVFAITDMGRELMGLLAVPVDGGPSTLLAGRDDAELEDAVLSADRRSAVLLWNVTGGTSDLSRLDLSTGREEPVRPLPDGLLSHPTVTGDGSRVIVTVEGPMRPRQLRVVDHGSAVGLPTPSAYDPPPGVHPASLERFTSSDGLELTAWLHTPAVERFPGPWPTLIWLHGGPEAQARPGFDPLFHALTSAGVAVLAPNVRGSSGFGRHFVHADDLGGRYGAFEDVRACVEHLIESGVAIADRIGCAGRSYGGYLTLAALVRFPELFAVGVDVCGMSDLETFYAHTEPWIAAAAVSKYGDPHRDRQLLHDLSPIHAIDNLVAPLLVVHGENDSNVPRIEAEQVVQALEKRGREHRYLLFDGEGHELAKRSNKEIYVRETVSWVTRWLQA